MAHPHDPVRALHQASAEFREALDRLTTLHLNPITEWENIMSALSDLKALAPRLDAIATAIPQDIATTVASATAGLTQQLADATSAASTAETDLQATVSDLTAKVAALETAAGVPAPVAAEEPAPAAEG